MRKAAFALLLTACLVSAESAGARVVATLHPARAALQQGPSLEAIRALDVDGRQLAVATARSRGFGVEADRVTVYDLERRAARYEVEIPPRSPLISLDVGSGGSLAVDTGAGGTQCQDTVTIHGPAGAETGRVAACRLVAELADETIVVIPRGERRAIVSMAAGATTGRTLFRLGRVVLTGADADRDELALALPDCTGRQEIRVEPMSGPPIGAGPAARPAALADRRPAVSSDARAIARVRCRRGCHGVLRLLVGRRSIAARGFWARPGGTSLRLPLRPWARRRLATGPLAATARLTTSDRADRSSVLTRPVTLAPS